MMTIQLMLLTDDIDIDQSILLTNWQWLCDEMMKIDEESGIIDDSSEEMTKR